MYAKLKPLSPTKTPGKISGGAQTMDSTGKKAEEGVKGGGRSVVAEETQASIDNFEARLRTMPLSGLQATPSSSPQQTTTTITASTTTGNVSGEITHFGASHSVPPHHIYM